MIAANVAISRARRKETILIMQPFAPGLFAQGPPIGPTILMKVLRGQVAFDNVDDEFKRMATDAKATCYLIFA